MNAIIKISKDFARAAKSTKLILIPFLIINALVIFLITIPALFIAGFSIGLVNLQNPLKAAIELIEELL